MSTEDIVIHDETLAELENSVQEMAELTTVNDVSQAIMDRLTAFKEQHQPHETTYEDLSLLAEAAVGLEILRQLPVSNEDTYGHKQDALMVHADNVGGYLTSVLVHKDQTGIPEAKVVYDRLVSHGMDVLAEGMEADVTETLEM